MSQFRIPANPVRKAIGAGPAIRLDAKLTRNRRRRRPARIPSRSARLAKAAKPVKSAEVTLERALRTLLRRWAAEAIRLLRSQSAIKLDAEPEQTEHWIFDRALPVNLDRHLSRFGEQLAESRDFQAATTRAATQVGKANELALQAMGIRVRDKGDALDRQIKKWRKDAVETVTGITKAEAGRLRGILEEGVHTSVDTLAKRIEERLDVSITKAIVIARTETARLNSQISESRHRAAGITEFVWTTSGDERVSDSHAELDGEKFSYDDPPTDADGNTGVPGQIRPNCRCVAYPVIPEFDDDESA